MRLWTSQRLELKDFDAALFGGCPKRIRFAARFLRRAKNRRNVLSTFCKRVENPFAEVLLSNNDNSHVFSFWFAMARETRDPRPLAAEAHCRMCIVRPLSWVAAKT